MDEMSMFKKMKERITDEVNSATSKLNNMQIIDQLASNLNNQNTSNNFRNIGTTNNYVPNLALPELATLETTRSSNPLVLNNQDFVAGKSNLRENDFVANLDEDDVEQDSKISPQHQLFSESSIRRLDHYDKKHVQVQDLVDHSNSVVNLNELHSDLDDDAEINLLFCNETSDSCNASTKIDTNVASYKARYRNLVHALRKLDEDRKKEIERLEEQTRYLNNQLNSSKKELIISKQYNSCNRDSSTLSASSSQSDNIDKNIPGDGRSSPQASISSFPNVKQARKIRDLEKLIAKCKESLKAKNSQLQILKDSLTKVDQFKEMLDIVKSDLLELKKTYETWTVLIAENKRVMHQEIEDKISEMEKYKSEIKFHQLQIQEQNYKINHFKSNIQSLESRLVNISAAHQKERESLIREMNTAKNTALREQQREYELQTERIKLDLEKSIEALKSELLGKDEQIINSAKRQNELDEQNQILVENLNIAQKKLTDALEQINELKSSDQARAQEILKLETYLENISKVDQGGVNFMQESQRQENELKHYQTKCNEYDLKCSQLENKTLENNNEISKLTETNFGLTTKLKELESYREEFVEVETKNHASEVKISQLSELVDELKTQVGKSEQERNELLLELNQIKTNAVREAEPKTCQNCKELKITATKFAENYEQNLHELNSRLDLMTTANNDQEKAISEQQCKYENTLASMQVLRAEYEESVKMNETFSQIIQDNESEIQQQQDQIDQLTAVKQDIDNYKKENSILISNLNQIKQELSERNTDLNYSKEKNEKTKEKLADLEEQVKSQLISIEALRNERGQLSKELAEETKKRNEIDRQVIVSILSAIKNLETPDTSPGSDKFLAEKGEHDKSFDDIGDWSQDEQLDSFATQSYPDPLRLAKELSKLAMNKSDAYTTAAHHLQAVLLDNKMISDELRRLKDEINSLNQEKSQEVKYSLDEVERLRTENQALIHDQKAYDDQILSLEGEIEFLTNQIDDIKTDPKQLLEDKANKFVDTDDVGTEIDDDEEQIAFKARCDELNKLLASREEEIKNLKSTISGIMAKGEQSQRLKQHVEPEQQETLSDAYVPDSTEFEYLKNIVYQFMVGREPLTLARVISAVFKFDKNQIDQICKIQEAIHQISG